MCGIGGIIHFDGSSVEKQQLLNISKFLKERGPDHFEHWISQHIGLVHHRLSIIDLSSAGNQPMQDVTETVVITFNGVIYNFNAIKVDLIKHGYAFKSNSDTEVIINGYLHWGIEKLLTKIDGMFAFLLYDKKTKLAYACRDRFGKKPFYYYHTNSQFAFSSDIRSLHCYSPNLTLDFESLNYYLTELTTPQPKTIWKEVNQIKPAHYITINTKTGYFEQKQYWTLTPGAFSGSAKEAQILVEDELKRAVRDRSVGDVTIGTFLSGGVDSGLITALLATQSSKKIPSFSVGFKYEKYNELPQANNR